MKTYTAKIGGVNLPILAKTYCEAVQIALEAAHRAGCGFSLRGVR